MLSEQAARVVKGRGQPEWQRKSGTWRLGARLALMVEEERDGDDGGGSEHRA